MIKLGAVSTCTRGLITPHFLEDLIIRIHGQFFPFPSA